MSLRAELLSTISESTTNSQNKITIVGCGHVGMACAVACLAREVTTDITLIDAAEDKLIGEQMDLKNGSLYFNFAKIKASNTYDSTAGSKICIITAGVRLIEGESGLNLITRNVDIFRQIIPNLVRYSPDTLLVVVSTPVDILTYVAWKLSNLPKSRVIGSGTFSDTLRFRQMIARRMGVSTSSVDGWIIGQHGEKSLPIWSSVNIAGVRLCELYPNIGGVDDEGKWGDIHKTAVEVSNEIVILKGYTNWTIGLCISSICAAIIKNTSSIFPITTCAQGEYNIDSHIFLSLPCVVGANGVTHIVKQLLTNMERNKLLESANHIAQIIDSLQLVEIQGELKSCMNI